MDALESIQEFLVREFQFGSIRLSPLSILVGVMLIALLVMVTTLLKRALRERFLPRAGLNPGVSAALATLLSYFVLIVGVLLIMPVMLPGFSLATLSVILGAVSFGIGFGLRNVADNFVSGIILLLERPIKVGDRIQVGNVFGDVREIRARSTTVRTNDNVTIIVPNSEFISGQVTNVSHNDNLVRFRHPVGVHYKSDVDVVTKALLEAAGTCQDVLKDPPPAVRFMEFGDSSLNFEVWVWTETMFNRPQNLRSQVNYAVWHALKRHGIEIPYPQRDLYVKEMPAAWRDVTMPPPVA